MAPLTAPQKNALLAISNGQKVGHNSKTLDALAKRRLIQVTSKGAKILKAGTAVLQKKAA